MNIVRRVAFTSEFDAFFQPIIHARTGRIHHYEALARFPGADAALTPHDHISLAERTGLITAFDIAMVRKMIAWLGGQSSHHDAVRVAVNISGRSVSSLACLTELDALLRGEPWLRGRLMFEITETAHIGNLVAANAFLQRLRRQGFLVCLDDFGAGAASFEYLTCLDVDIVKLDGAWLHAARSSRPGETFLRELVGVCRDLGVTTVAEMIEDELSLEVARGCGVTYVQGFLFGEPASDIRAFRNSIPAQLFPPKLPAPALQRRRTRMASPRRA